MKHEVVINKKGLTDIRGLKDHNAVAQHMTLKGKGELNGCLLTFSIEGDGPHGQTDLLFLKPARETYNKLYPHRIGMVVSRYDYCNIQIFTGTIQDDDIIILHLSSENKA